MKPKELNYSLTKRACYFTYLVMSAIFTLPPLLFVTFHEMYSVSYTLLGTLVLVNFCTQLTIDLIFSFFTKYFNIRLTVLTMPVLTCLGLLVYSVVPVLFPDYAYAGLVSGTVIFSLAAGLCEVLLSPLIAAVPSDTPDKDMSRLHSLYAYGVVGVVTVSTVYLKIFGSDKWYYLTGFFAVIQLVAFILFCIAPIPEMNITHSVGGINKNGQLSGILLCMLCIFLGSAAENSMTNWISGYVENALKISKVLGDILGMAMFAVLLGLGRTLYTKYGKNIHKVLLIGMFGAFLCYLVSGLSVNPVISMIACVLTGFCTSMLWPGTLIYMEENFTNAGVTAYALMAAGGDFGGSVAPQLVGYVVDKVSESGSITVICDYFKLTPEQVGMKAGMLIAGLFPLFGIAVLIFMKRFFRKECEQNERAS